MPKLLWALSLSLLLSACGQAGPLYLGPPYSDTKTDTHPSMPPVDD